MRLSRAAQAALLAASLGGAAAVFTPGCRDATQMTLEISLAPKIVCDELHGTAITVGVDPLDTADRVRDEYVTSTTYACDPASRMVGTLVLTPGEDGKASVIVVAAYDKTLQSPEKCDPPDFKGCIVARRRFSFSSHKKLRMPITLDPDCKDVPCDALSTCRKGNCYSSEVVIEGDTVPPEPGALPDGGTSEAGVIIPDAGGDGSPTLDGSTDAPTDAPIDSFTPDAPFPDGGPSGVSCAGPVLYCPNDMGMPVECRGGLKACCITPAGASIECTNGSAECDIASPKYCCEDADCLTTPGVDGGVGLIPGSFCNKSPPQTVGTCGPMP